MKTAHTPTPWSLEKPDTASYRYEIGETMTTKIYGPNPIDFPESEANAAHIVKAVNLHEELVEAFTELHNELSDMIILDDSGELVEKVQKYKDLLLRARGEK